MPRKTDFTPSRMLSFLAAAVVTIDSPQDSAAVRRNGGAPGLNQIQVRRVCRGLDLNRREKRNWCYFF
jgi:hypothetical protein